LACILFYSDDQACPADWEPPAPGVKLACNLLEVAFVFFPYIWLRPMFPTTRLGTAIGNVETKSTKENQWFYFLGTWAIKVSARAKMRRMRFDEDGDTKKKNTTTKFFLMHLESTSFYLVLFLCEAPSSHSLLHVLPLNAFVHMY